MDSLHHCEAVSNLNSQLLYGCSGIKMAAPVSVRTKEQHADDFCGL
jgi:hypothetical protein